MFARMKNMMKNEKFPNSVALWTLAWPNVCLSLINKFVRVSQSPGAGCCPNFEQDVKMSKCLHLMIFLSLLFCKQKAFVPEPGLEKMFAPESWLQKNVCTWILASKKRLHLNPGLEKMFAPESWLRKTWVCSARLKPALMGGGRRPPEPAENS